ncbi:MAG TPA: DUF5916 domain-containing protein [Longimicrobiales bacterium]|nr:DUF5916 domain-containing protein [Longimicrobiales bacterium]
MRSIAVVIAAVILIPTASAHGQVAQAAPNVARPAAPLTRVLTAAPVGHAVPAIDGRLDDAAWADAEIATDFVVYQPNPGAPSAQRTEARVLYDDGAIYVAMRMYDTSPDSIVGRLARRDETVHSDWAYVGIDSYHDRRTAFVFGTNPRGVKVDLMIYDDRMENISWDAIWEVATTTDSLGWTAEFRIPLSQLRFNGENGVARTWGVQFRRQIARLDESSFWSPVPRDANGQASLFGELHGLRGLNPPRNIEVVPYSVARATRAPGDPADPFFRRTDPGLDAGADLKYGITPNLTLNATLNPDFGQVEADPSVVNLSAFETFLPEKRPFFVEGANIFNFGVGVGDGDLGNESLFYSRRIGRAPQGSVPDDATYDDAPVATRILGAAKLSGRTPGGWSVGALNATTASAHARYVIGDGTRDETMVEPLTNYAVARLLRDYDQGRGSVGVIATATNRQLDGEMTYLRSAAYTGGMNAYRRIGDFEFTGWVVGSHVRGDTAAIARTQRSAARYYQRPDADHVTYDPTRTSLDGWAAAAEVMKMGGGHWRFASMLNVRSPGFEPNDLGYMQNADQALQVAYVGYNQFKPSTHFRRWSVNVNQWASWNFGGDRTWLGGNMNANVMLHSFWGGGGGINREMARYDVAALRGGPALAMPGSWNGWAEIYTDSRKPVRGRLNLNGWREDGTAGRSWRVSPGLTVRATSQAELSLTPAYGQATRASQYVRTRTADGESVYVLSRLEQTSTSVTARLNYTASPTLSFQVYAQPFISAGRYSDFMEVASPRARTFDGRFTRYAPAQVAYDADDNVYRIDRNGDGTPDYSFGNPDFNFKQMRSNAVMRWEYRPGSTLFLVWSHGRTAEDGNGDFRFGRDVSDLWSTAGSNTLLVKVSYWLGI